MNSVDAALQNIAFEVNDPAHFEQEKAKFVVSFIETFCIYA